MLSGGATDVLNTYHQWRTIKRKKNRFFFSSLDICTSVDQEIERLWITCFAYNKRKSTAFFFKRIFLYSHLSCKYIYSFIIWMYFTLYVYIYIESNLFFFFSDNSTHSTNECKWTAMISDCLPDWNLCNHHLLMYCLSDIFYLCMYITDKVKK